MFKRCRAVPAPEQTGTRPSGEADETMRSLTAEPVRRREK